MANSLNPKEKLNWCGLSEAASTLSNVQSEVEILKDNLADYATFVDHLENGYTLDGDSSKTQLDDFASFNEYLQDPGINFSSSEADDFILKIKQSFVDEDSSGSVFDEFKTFAINQSSFEELKGGFGNSNQLTSELETSGGVPAAGIKFHESGGVTRNGESVPAGTTEVYGLEIHFSEANPPQNPATSGGFNVTNISATDTVPTIGEQVRISVDVENTSKKQQFFSASFTEDGSQIANRGITFNAGETKTVPFDVTKNNYTTHEYRINSSNSVTVSWVSSGIRIT